MGGDSEYEPKDSRNVTGTARTRDAHWTGDPQKPGHGGEYEPRDSRNVTGTASTPDGRWTNRDGAPPLAGEPSEEDDDEEDEQPVVFEPDPALRKLIREGRH